jgi:hypothetical protein
MGIFCQGLFVLPVPTILQAAPCVLFLHALPALTLTIMLAVFVLPAQTYTQLASLALPQPVSPAPPIST